MAGLGDEMIQAALHPTRVACDEAGLSLKRLAAYWSGVVGLGEAEIKVQSKRKRPKPNCQVIKAASEAAHRSHELRGDYAPVKSASTVDLHTDSLDESVAAAIGRLKESG